MPTIAATRSKLLVSCLSVALDGQTGPWVQLMPAGTFNGRDGRGPYIAGDKVQLERIADATRRYAGATDLVIDYEHQTLKAADNGKPAPAAGWVKELEARNDGLYGRIEWTATAAAAIAAHEYRYLSPVLFHTAEGRVLGLQMAALTNAPNLQMAEVSAHAVDIFQPAEDPDPMHPKLKKLLGLAEDASDDAVYTAVNSLITGAEAIAVLAGKAAGTPAAEVAAALTSAMSVTAPDPQKFVPIAQVSALQADLKTLKEQLAKSSAETDVDVAIKAGKLVPALKEWGISLHAANPKAFKDFIAGAPVLTAAQASGRPPAEKKEGELDDVHRRVASAMGIDPAAYAKTLATEAAEKENE